MCLSLQISRRMFYRRLCSTLSFIWGRGELCGKDSSGRRKKQVECCILWEWRHCLGAAWCQPWLKWSLVLTSKPCLLVSDMVYWWRMIIIRFCFWSQPSSWMSVSSHDYQTSDFRISWNSTWISPRQLFKPNMCEAELPSALLHIRPLVWRCHIHSDIHAMHRFLPLSILHWLLVPDRRNFHSEAVLCLPGLSLATLSFHLSSRDSTLFTLGLFPAWNMPPSVTHLSLTLSLWLGWSITCHWLSGGHSLLYLACYVKCLSSVTWPLHCIQHPPRLLWVLWGAQGGWS